ncbi:MAG TPA: LLM class flavin-dependent oxidoreductase [Pseudonocardiaceae bacterium]|nr:LLM class flavin-dependent oxidoreductase [Pseudonocardiaceae bacterium]
MDHIHLGVLVPIGQAQWGAGTDPRDLVGFAIRAERLGFDSLWVNDSILSPRIEALTMLAAAAAVTERVTLGTAALMPVLRRPVLTAQTLASLDLLSGGRLVVTVGAGFPGPLGRPMYDLSDTPWPRRFARLDETVDLWRRMWTADGTTSFHGDVLHYDDIPRATHPHRAGGPPVWLAGATPKALRRTGERYDGWLPYPPDPADYGTGLAAVRAAAAGRPVTPALFVTIRIADTEAAGRAVLAEYSKANYGVPLEQLETVQALVTGPIDHVAARLAEYTAAGARHVVCRIAAPDLTSTHEQLDLLTDLKERL